MNDSESMGEFIDPKRVDPGEGETKGPQGVVVIITSPDGYVQAVAGDFSQLDPPGFLPSDQKCVQQTRAENQAWREVIINSCSKLIADAIMGDGMTRRTIADRLLQSGCTFTVKTIGYGDDPQGL